ncbi:MAG: PilN domain-containing protein [Actinomycetota bacterium]
MYSIDINFLNDRPDLAKALPKPKQERGPQVEVNPTPILIGAGIAIAVNAAVGAGWFLLSQQKNELQTKLSDLNTKLQNQSARVQQIKAINDRTTKITNETSALASVFYQMKPWSALLQELSERIPAGVQITNIAQTEPSPSPVSLAPSPGASPTASASPSPGQSPTASASPSASPTPTATPSAAQPAPTSKVEISGQASTFAQVNDFLVLLRRSPFFKSDDTRLVAATLKDNSTQLQLRGLSNSGSAVDLPKLRPVVEYKIETNLSDASASDLLPQLKQNGSQGLTVRIDTLQEQGVLEQPKEVKKP